MRHIIYRTLLIVELLLRCTCKGEISGYNANDFKTTSRNRDVKISPSSFHILSNHSLDNSVDNTSSSSTSNIPARSTNFNDSSVIPKDIYFIEDLVLNSNSHTSSNLTETHTSIKIHPENKIETNSMDLSHSSFLLSSMEAQNPVLSPDSQIVPSHQNSEIKISHSSEIDNSKLSPPQYNSDNEYVPLPAQNSAHSRVRTGPTHVSTKSLMYSDIISTHPSQLKPPSQRTLYSPPAHTTSFPSKVTTSLNTSISIIDMIQKTDTIMDDSHEHDSYFPIASAFDVKGNLIFSDSHHFIKHLFIDSSKETIIIAGVKASLKSLDGFGTYSSFNIPFGIAIDHKNKGDIFVSDSGSHLIRKISSQTLETSTVAGRVEEAGCADGVGTFASFNRPRGIALDHQGSLIVADTSNNLIRKIFPTGMVVTIAGSFSSFGRIDGMGLSASFAMPFAVAIDRSNNIVVADTANSLIRMISSSSNTVTTLVLTTGDEKRSLVPLNNPRSVAVDKLGNILVADYANHLIRSISPSGTVSTTAGTNDSDSTINTEDRFGTFAEFWLPSFVSLDSKGQIAVLERRGIRFIKHIALSTSDLAHNAIPSHSPSFPSSNNALQTPKSKLIPKSTPSLVLSSTNSTLVDEEITIFEHSAFGPLGADVDNDGSIVFSDSNHVIQRLLLPFLSTKQDPNYSSVSVLAGTSGIAGWADGLGTFASFKSPYGITIDKTHDGDIYVADSGNHLIRKISHSSTVDSPCITTTIAGRRGEHGAVDALGTFASFNRPRGVAIDREGNLIIADSSNNMIRKIILSTGLVVTIAGSLSPGRKDGFGTVSSSFHLPFAVTVDTHNNIFIADTANSLIRKIVKSSSPTDSVYAVSTLLAGSSKSKFTKFHSLRSLAVDLTGNIVVADYGNNAVQMISLISGEISTIPTPGSKNYSPLSITSVVGVAFHAASNAVVVLGQESIRVIPIPLSHSPLTI